MKLTNELRDYVNRRISETIPEPASKQDFLDVKKTCDDLETQYHTYMSECAKKFINVLKDDPSLKDISFEASVEYRVRDGYTYKLSSDISKHEAVQQYHTDSEQYRQFRERVSEKIYALLSVQKEVSDLDAFINHAIETATR